MQRVVRVLIAFDKFKDCMGAEALGLICSNHLDSIFHKRIISKVIPLSDGGEGFVESLKRPLDLEVKSETVTGPLGTPITAQYGLNKAGSVAVVEMAQASGIEKVPKEKRNPLYTTTHGTGEIIKAAYNSGARKFILGVGGTATNDGGIGALHALGVQVEVDDNGGIQRPDIHKYKKRNNEDENRLCTDIIYGKHLPNIRRIFPPANQILPGATFDIACDVTSPFVGLNGATHVFGPQKGANEHDQEILEAGMQKLAKLYKETFGVDVSNLPGAGAAGGLPGGFVAALGATLKKGIQIIFDEYNLEQEITKSDLVITGEGAYDKTTKAGKVVQQVRELSARHNVPVIVICGRKKDTDESDTHIYDILSVCQDEKKAMTQTESCLQQLIDANVKCFPVLKDL